MFNPNIYTTAFIKTSLSTKSKTVFLPGSRQVYAQVWERTCFPFTGHVKELQFLGFLFWYSESYTTSYRPQRVESWMVSMAELHPTTGTPVHDHWTLAVKMCSLERGITRLHLAVRRMSLGLVARVPVWVYCVKFKIWWKGCGCFSGIRLGPLVPLTGTLNASTYQDILDNFPTLWERCGVGFNMTVHQCTNTGHKDMDE